MKWKLLSLVLFTSMCSGLQAQEVAGLWQSIDDRTGEPKALVRVFTKGGKLYGTIQKILVEGKENARCTACKGERKDKPVVGMDVIGGIEKTGPLEWQGDDLFDPEQGSSFRCKIWLDPEQPDILYVRGFLAFFYRTQTWKRVVGD